MPAIEPAVRGDAGFIEPHRGLWKSVPGIARSGIPGTPGTRQGPHKAFFFEDVSAGDGFWPSGMTGIVTLATQSDPDHTSGAFFDVDADQEVGRIAFTAGAGAPPFRVWLYVWQEGPRGGPTLGGSGTTLPATQGTAGFIDPHRGIWNGAGAYGTNLFAGGRADFARGLGPLAFFFTGFSNGDTWTEPRLRGVRALATQTLDAAHPVAANLESEADAEAGRITFRGIGPVPRRFWLYVWKDR